MTVTLAYDNANAKVAIDADALTAVSQAKIERSINQIQWTTVRGGADVELTGGSLLLPGTAGNYASTPDNAALDITGDIDIRADVTPAVWVGAEQSLVAKWNVTGNQRSYVLEIVAGTGKVALIWSNNGTAENVAVSTVAVPVVAGRLAVRATLDVDNGAAGRTITFYTGPALAGPWTQLGAPVVQGGTTSIFSSTAILEAGSINSGTALAFTGTMHAVEVRSGIASTVVAVPNFEFLAAGTTGFTDGVGRAWTLNGTASIPTREFVTQVDDYEFAPNVVNYYRVGSATQPSGLFLPGITGSFASTSDNAALDIVGDIDLRADVTLPLWTISGIAFIGKWNESTNNRSYLLYLGGGGTLHFAWSADGTAVVADVASTIPVPAANGRLAVRATLDVDNGAAGRTITFYTAGAIDGTWVQLGSPVVQGGVTSIFSGASIAEVGAHTVGALAPLLGTVHAAEVRNGIGGTAVANPIFTAQAFGTTGFTDAAGRVWTVNRAMIIGYATAQTVPALDRIWLKSVTRAFLNRPVTVVGFTDPVRPDRGAEHDVVNRTLPVAVTDLSRSRRWTVDLHVSTRADAQTMDYILAAGDIMFLHVPRNCDVPGGYVKIKNPGQRHPEGRVRGESRIFTLPLVEVAPPGADVAAVVGTWNSVLAAYPTWDAVLAAFPTWNDLLALHGDPSEVIVP